MLICYRIGRHTPIQIAIFLIFSLKQIPEAAAGIQTESFPEIILRQLYKVIQRADFSG